MGRPIAYCGDPDSPDLTPAERRRIKRRIANRESARRVRARRQGDIEEMSHRWLDCPCKSMQMTALQHACPLVLPWVTVMSSYQTLHQSPLAALLHALMQQSAGKGKVMPLNWVLPAFGKIFGCITCLTPAVLCQWGSSGC